MDFKDFAIGAAGGAAMGFLGNQEKVNDRTALRNENDRLNGLLEKRDKALAAAKLRVEQLKGTNAANKAEKQNIFDADQNRLDRENKLEVEGLKVQNSHKGASKTSLNDNQRLTHLGDLRQEWMEDPTAKGKEPEGWFWWKKDAVPPTGFVDWLKEKAPDEYSILFDGENSNTTVDPFDAVSSNIKSGPVTGNKGDNLKMPLSPNSANAAGVPGIPAELPVNTGSNKTAAEETKPVLNNESTAITEQKTAARSEIVAAIEGMKKEYMNTPQHVKMVVLDILNKTGKENEPWKITFSEQIAAEVTKEKVGDKLLRKGKEAGVSVINKVKETFGETGSAEAANSVVDKETPPLPPAKKTPKPEDYTPGKTKAEKSTNFVIVKMILKTMKPKQKERFLALSPSSKKWAMGKYVEKFKKLQKQTK